MDPARHFDFIRRVLGEYDLRTPARVVLPNELSERSKAYLSEVGLPGAEVAPGLDFNLVDRLPTPKDFFPAHKFAFHETWLETRLIHARYDCEIFLDLSDGGTVWQVDLQRPKAIGFVNSCVELLGLGLALLNAPSPTDGDPGAKAWLVELEAQLREADPVAFDETADCFWPLVIEDQSYYLI